MTMDCQEVWRELSNYLDGEVDPTSRSALEEHVRGCRRCTAVLAGTRNVIQLYGDERMSEVPVGFSYRLHRRLEDNMPRTRRRFLGWAVAAAAAVLLAGGFELDRSTRFHHPELRSAHAQPGAGVPPEMTVVMAEDGKIFHVPGCRFIHDPATVRTITAQSAIREGYTPCVRCLKKYLNNA